MSSFERCVRVAPSIKRNRESGAIIAFSHSNNSTVDGRWSVDSKLIILSLYLLSFLALFLFVAFLAFGYIRLKIDCAAHLPNGTKANIMTKKMMKRKHFIRVKRLENNLTTTSVDLQQFLLYYLFVQFAVGGARALRSKHEQTNAT